MSSYFDEYGVTVSDVQGLFSSYLHSRILFVFVHAIHTCIFVVALYYILVDPSLDRKQLALIAIITYLWCSDTVIMGIEWSNLDNILIRHGESLESEFLHYMLGDATSPMVMSIFRSLDVTLADMVLMWRCWTMYEYNWKVAAGLIICLITEIISFIFIFLLDPYDGLALATVNWIPVFYTMTVVTNSVCPALILYRILRFKNAGVNIRTYRGIVELLIESAVVYSLIYMTLIALYVYEFYMAPDLPFMHWYFYPLVLSWSITGITPTLIIIRAMAGRRRANTQPHTENLPQSLGGPKAHGGGEVTTPDIQEVDLEVARIALAHEERGRGSSEVMIIGKL